MRMIYVENNKIDKASKDDLALLNVLMPDKTVKALIKTADTKKISVEDAIQEAVAGYCGE